jgi:hypothetical protein
LDHSLAAEKLDTGIGGIQNVREKSSSLKFGCMALNDSRRIQPHGFGFYERVALLKEFDDPLYVFGVNRSIPDELPQL